MQVEGVVDAATDMNRHEITVTLKSPDVPLDGVIRALNKAGYTVGEPREVKGDKP